MYEILKAICDFNNWFFQYGRSDFQNLMDIEEEKNKAHVFLDPLKIKDIRNDMGVIEKRSYVGKFMILYSSDIDEESYDYRYQTYIKPILDSSLVIINDSLRCDYKADFKQWEITEVINILDYNLDGIIVTFNIELDYEEIRIVTPKYAAIFTVVDEFTNPIEGADVYVEGVGIRATNSEGMAIFTELERGNYNYEITDDSFESVSGSFAIIDKDVYEVVSMPPLPYELIIDSRENLTLIDSLLTGNDVEVVGGVAGVLDGASSIDIDDFEFTVGKYIEIDNIDLTQVGTTSNYFIGGTSSGIRYNGSNFIIALGVGGFTSLNYTVVLPNVKFRIEHINTRNYSVYIDGIYLGNLYHGETDNYLTVLYIGRRSEGLFFTGSMCCVDLNSEAIYPLNGNTYDSITGTKATNNGVTFESVKSYTPKSTEDGINLGYYQNDITFEKVVNPQYPLPTGWTRYQAAILHNYIDSFIDFSTVLDVQIKSFFDRSDSARYIDPKPDDEFKYMFTPEEMKDENFQALLYSQYRDIVTIEYDSQSINVIKKITE